MNYDEIGIRAAIQQAKIAFENQEVPIGAVAMLNGKIIAKGYNQVELLNDSSAHAEMIVLTSAMNYLQSKYLKDVEIYVTLEPCVMCAGALKWAQVQKLVYGLPDPKNGFSQYSQILHPKTKVISGIFEDEILEIMKNFFQNKR